jgi:predicted DNA-binding protein (MmcQ/YjbR family)
VGVTSAAFLAGAAAGYPGATEDFPWGERVAKVNKKIFAFLGRDDADDPTVALKLPVSAEHALALGCSEPTSHGLGRAHWVTVHLTHPHCPDDDLLLDWLDESYRAVAPARLIATLESPPPG